MTAATTTTPRVWVACLACYVDGRLVGKWADAVDADALWADIAEVLAHGETDPYGPHEEHAFHDFEGFAGYRVGEYETVESVCAAGALIEEHGEAVALWLANDSTNLDRVGDDPDTLEAAAQKLADNADWPSWEWGF